MIKINIVNLHCDSKTGYTIWKIVNYKMIIAMNTFNYDRDE